MTSSNDVSAIAEAVWEAGEEYGFRLTARQQVEVARAIAADPRMDADGLRRAFSDAGAASPSRRHAKSLLSRTHGLRPGSERQRLRRVLADFRQDAIRNLSSRFGGGKARGRESDLRDYLLMYLPQRGYAEAHTGRGRTDILIPPEEDAIIEVKIWSTVDEFENGIEELGRYIHTERPRQAFVVVFGDRDPLPTIIADYNQVEAEERHIEGLDVPVIVVPFEVDAPSKARRAERRRARDGG
jgi:hypothetical protein